MKKPKSYSIDTSIIASINKIWRNDTRYKSASDWVNEVLKKAVEKTKSK